MSRVRTTVYALLTATIMIVVVACTAAMKGAQTALDIGDAACEVVELNYDNATAKLLCNYIDKADSAARLISMVIPTEQARAFKKSKNLKTVGHPQTDSSASK